LDVIDTEGRKSTFKPRFITNSLIAETGMPKDQAEKIARNISKSLRKLDKESIFRSEIREKIKFYLEKHNLQQEADDYDTISISMKDIDNLLTNGNSDNANMDKTPETTHKYLADMAFKQYNLKKMDKKIAEAHTDGFIHCHDLEYETERGNNCIQSDLRFFIKNGVKIDGTGKHTSVATPAKSLNTLINHAGQILMASQGQMSGGQGYGYFNIFIAPFCKGLTYKTIKDAMQSFIYNLNMSYCSRGGQSVFSSINLELGIPSFLKNEDAWGPSGKIIGKYDDYENEARLVLEAIIEVIKEMDGSGKPHHFPNVIFTLRNEFMDDEEILLKIHELISKVPTPYLVNGDIDGEGLACSVMGCRTFLGQTYTGEWDKDTLRCGNLAYVTLNLPRIAYIYKDNFYKGLKKYLDIANKSLLYRREIVQQNIYNYNNLKFLHQKDNFTDEEYFRWENSSMAFGYCGLHEALINLGEEYNNGLLDEQGLNKGLEIINFIKDYADDLKKDTGYRYAVFASPAESTASRFANIDKEEFDDIFVQEGNTSNFYTNSSHVPVNADIELSERIKIEIKFHELTKAGNILHIFLGEEHPNSQGMLSLTKKIKEKGGRFWAYTNDYTFCYSCNSRHNGIHLKCDTCGEKENIESFSRITGYYQKIKPKNSNQGWTPGKKEELKQRKRYNII